MGFFRLPFASQLQIVLLVGMILAFLLIAQNQSVDVYGYGLLLLIGFSLLQVVAGNIPPQTRLFGTLVRLVLGLVIVAAVFAIGILLVPYLAQLGRGD
ncbi:MAG: hypothetical protein JO025_28105 [Verrucomicrobia bacterium]|nr:hypothetical protein [Verrucomicrobiota bacterium]